jgi:hypothetical protein
MDWRLANALSTISTGWTPRMITARRSTLAHFSDLFSWYKKLQLLFDFG